MRNFSLILNGILIIAVGILYYLHFRDCGASAAATNGVPSSSDNMIGENNPIVFVNSDSLLEEYEYYKQKKDEFEASQARIKSELKTQGDKLQQEIETYQQQAGSMSETQRMQKEEQLTMKQQQLMSRKDELLNKLDEDQSKSSEELYSKLNDYFKRNNKNYTYVLGFQKGGGILFANDSLNITREVVEGLNKEYKENNK